MSSPAVLNDLLTKGHYGTKEATDCWEVDNTAYVIHRLSGTQKHTLYNMRSSTLAGTQESRRKMVHVFQSDGAPSKHTSGRHLNLIRDTAEQKIGTPSTNQVKTPSKIRPGHRYDCDCCYYDWYPKSRSDFGLQIVVGLRCSSFGRFVGLSGRAPREARGITYDLP